MGARSGEGHHHEKGSDFAIANTNPHSTQGPERGRAGIGGAMSKPLPVQEDRPQGTAGPPPIIWSRPSVTALEADLAYFKARLAFIGTPTTRNQEAQVTTFLLLIQSTTRVLHHLLSKDA